MSELEKMQRDLYQKKRNKYILIQSIVAVILVLATLFTLGAYIKLNEETYVHYNEKGSASYKVYLEDNDFYDESFLTSNKAYIASLVDTVAIDMLYQLKMEEKGVDFKYSYTLKTILTVLDKQSGSPIFTRTYSEIDPVSEQVSGNSVTIDDKVVVDYHKYNDIAESFIQEYALTNTSSTLTVKLNVTVVGDSDSFAAENVNQHTVDVEIPLCKTTFNIKVRATADGSQERVLACANPLKNTFKALSVIFGILSLLVIIFLSFFTVYTRDKHIDYSRKVKRILSSYKSYIQRITNPFSFNNYQTVSVASFKELLAIRDTIQIPVLMYENDDRTLSQFFIAANEKLLYLFEVSVEDDEDEVSSYCEENDPFEEVAEITLTEESAEEANTPEEPTRKAIEAAEEEAASEEAAAKASADESDENTADEGELVPILELELPVEDSEDISGYREIRLRRSFTAKLIQANDSIKEYYSSIKNELLSYKGVKARLSWGAETFKSGRIHLVKTDIKGKTLYVYLSLDPVEFEESKYFFLNISEKNKNFPMLMKVRSKRALKHIKELISVLMEKNGLKKTERAEENYILPYETDEALVEKGLIKLSGAVIKEKGNSDAESLAEPELVK